MRYPVSLIAVLILLSLATVGDWPLKTLAVSSRSGAGIEALLTEIDGHWTHLATEDRLAVSRHHQSEGWVHEALQERFGARGLARLASLGLDASLTAGAQPFARLRELTERLEKTP